MGPQLRIARLPGNKSVGLGARRLAVAEALYCSIEGFLRPFCAIPAGGTNEQVRREWVLGANGGLKFEGTNRQPAPALLFAILAESSSPKGH